MSLREPGELILAFARLLYVNGQSTKETSAAASQLAKALGVSAVLLPRWGELKLDIADKGGDLSLQVAANPAGENMQQVAAATNALEDVTAGRIGPLDF